MNSSTVTATGGQDGYAVFHLTVPSAALPQTMNSLSRLRYAAVASRPDATEDVSNQFADVGRRLADARTLRTSLLRQLGGAGTQRQINSLQAQIHDAGRVLTVATGVALVGLAALVPVALLGALGWWIAAGLRRRRRQQALELA